MIARFNHIILMLYKSSFIELISIHHLAQALRWLCGLILWGTVECDHALWEPHAGVWWRASWPHLLPQSQRMPLQDPAKRSSGNWSCSCCLQRRIQSCLCNWALRALDSLKEVFGQNVLPRALFFSVSFGFLWVFWFSGFLSSVLLGQSFRMQNAPRSGHCSLVLRP